MSDEKYKGKKGKNGRKFNFGKKNIINVKSKNGEGYHGKRKDKEAYKLYISNKAKRLSKQTGQIYFHPTITNLYD